MVLKAPNLMLRFSSEAMAKLPRVCDTGDESSRLEELASFKIVGTSPEPRFDQIVALAAKVFNVPMAYISFLERHRQWLKSATGVGVAETERSIAFCTNTITSNEPFVVLDARKGPHFASDPLITSEPYIRFYAGAPLVTARGHRLGALCIADRKPWNVFDERQRQILKEMATLVMHQLELRRGELVRESMMGFADATELTLISADAQGRIEFVNKSAVATFGYAREEMIGKPIDIIIPDRLRGAHRAGLARVAAGAASKLVGKTVEVVARKRDGTEFPIDLSLSVWPDQSGLGFGAVIRDITERKERDLRLLRLATRDTLTGLCNRQHFEDLLSEVFQRQTPAAVLLLDIDGFKDITDTVGHAAGDAVLQAAAVRLPAVLDGNFPVARLGGDEFAILLAGVADPQVAQSHAAALMTAFETPFDVGGNVFQLGLSIGCALGPQDGSDPEELIASADFALHYAKKAGGRTARMFEREMRGESASRRAMQDELLRAHKNREFTLFYQPQVLLEDGRIFGMEALIRWHHPKHGLLQPTTFLPILERSSLALQVGWWILDEACRQLAKWHKQGRTDLRVGVNLFAAQFLSAGLIRQVLDTLAKHNLEPSALELEITETIALNDADQAVAQLKQLRDLGVRIAMDDFGTGYASLLTLKRFPLTTLKIDRGFVRDLFTDPAAAAIIGAMLAMGNELRLEIIAEGIESENQAQFLRAKGCEGGQGYLYGRPAPADSWLQSVSPARTPKARISRSAQRPSCKERTSPT
jgi:diguanylate cyclase (GGDEF)-like protein/PAS domain S-box-containing protein